MAKTVTPDSEKSDKLFDVAHPGKTPASATSRPVIVGHGSSIQKDPMMTGADDVTDTEAVSEPIDPTDPVQESDAPEETEERKPLRSKLNRIEVPASFSKDDDKEDDTKVVSEDSTDNDEQQSTGIVDTLVGEVSAKQEDRKQKDELAATIEEVEKSIAAKEFFVPIGVESRRRSKMRIFTISGVFLIAVLAGINFGIDAELIDIGVSALTDIL